MIGIGLKAGSVKVPSGLAVPLTLWPLGNVAVTVSPGVAPVPVTTPAFMLASIGVVSGALTVSVSGFAVPLAALTFTVSPLTGMGLKAGSVKVPSGLAVPLTLCPLGSVAVTVSPGVAPVPVTTALVAS